MAVPDQEQPQAHPQAQRILKAAAAGQAVQLAGKAGAAPAVTVAVPPATAAAVPVEVAGTMVKWAVILAILRRLFAKHHAESADWLTRQLTKQFPNADPMAIRRAVEREMQFERRFQQKALKRTETDFHAAAKLPTPDAQAKRVQQIVDREKVYAGLREQALMNRATSHVQNSLVKDESPGGAVWELGPRRTHTPGCLAMAGKAWPWAVLDMFPPPVHANCGCWLRPLGPGETVPEHGAALRAARAAMALEEAYAAHPGLRELREASFEEVLHPRGRGGRWITKLGGKKLELKTPLAKPTDYSAGKKLTQPQVNSRVRKVAEGLVDFYGGDKNAVKAFYEPEYLASRGVDAQFRDPGQTLPGLLYGTRVLEGAQDPEMGIMAFRQIAHEAAHSLSGTKPGPLPGFSQHVEEGGAEILSLWYAHHKMQAFDHRDAVKDGDNKWSAPGEDSLAHSVVYRPWVEELMRRAASKVGWDRTAIVDEVERAMRGDHNYRIYEFRDKTDPEFPLPKDLPGIKPGKYSEDESNAVPLIRWLIDTNEGKLQEAGFEEILHPRGRGGEWIRKLSAPGTTHVIAIDGPAASGKSTVARKLAERMGGTYIDTGSYYRAAGYAKMRGLNPASALRNERIRMREGGRITLDGTNIHQHLRTAEVDRAAAELGGDQNVRDAVNEAIRKHVNEGGVFVADGRDAGRSLNANDRIFLTARPEVRAARRAAARGMTVADAEHAIHQRDAMDAPRISQAHDAADHVIDSSDESVDQTVDHIIDTVAAQPEPEGFDISGLETEQARQSARAAEQAIREATGHAHRFGFTHLGSEDSATARALSGGKIAVEETTDPKFQISAIVHEYAHQLDRSVLGTESDWYTMNNAIPGNPLYDALMASPTVQKIKNDEVELLKGDPDRVKFAAMRELFARAFEQYVANRSSNQTLKERLRKLQADPMLGFQQWQDDEFKPIERELDKVLKQPLQEAIHWEEYLHPRGRGGKWVKAMGHARQEVEREQAQVHQEFTGEDFASAMDGFSHAGITAVRMNRTEAKGLYGRVWLDLQKGGGSVGSATLKLLPPVRGERVAEYEAMHLNESEQNQGFGRAFTDHLFETLRQGGVDRVKIQAVNVGGYAWARRGFVWTQDRKWIQGATLRDAKAEERWDDTVRHVSPERLAELERKIAAGEFTSEAELAAFGIEEPWQDTQGRRTWLGKEVMLGSNWEGELDLSGHAPPPDLLTDEVRAAMRAARLAHEGR